MLSDDDRWYRQQLGAAALGLIAGLIVVVPAVLWLSGFLGGPQKGPRPATAEAAQPEVKITVARPDAPKVPVVEVKKHTDIRPVKADPPSAERIAATPPPREVRAEVVAPPAPNPADLLKARTEELLSKAKRRILSGDIPGARAILQAPEAASSGPMTFMLAETYDPNMLASWQIMKRDIADTHKARDLYRKARDLGETQAERRLRPEWLGAN
jgi:hypothetical protein